ncbi:MAG: M67 family metallopeptidase [Candidatus Korarchaeota archaeon]|nr:M67 family metallopeptidase [Candidatus Korarchaeota archaeon]
MEVFIPKRVRDSIVSHALSEYPREACGLLAGEKVRGEGFSIKRAYRAKNISDTPLRYEIDPEDMYRAFLEAEKGSMEIIGAYHSHPLVKPLPSEIDEERAHPGFLYVIISVPRVRIGAFIWEEGRGFRELPVRIGEGPFI